LTAVRHLRLLVVLVGVGLLAATAAVIRVAPLPPSVVAAEVDDLAQPSRHFRVPNPARFSDALL
jgi:hypothetical protein